MLFPAGSRRRVPHYGKGGGSIGFMLMNLTCTMDKETDVRYRAIFFVFLDGNRLLFHSIYNTYLDALLNAKFEVGDLTKRLNYQICDVELKTLEAREACLNVAGDEKLMQKRLNHKLPK